MNLYDGDGNLINIDAETAPIVEENLLNVQYTDCISNAQMCLAFDVSEFNEITSESVNFDFLVADPHVTNIRVNFMQADSYSETSVGTAVSLGQIVSVTQNARTNYNESYNTFSTKDFVIFWIVFGVSNPTYPLDLKLYNFTFKVNGTVVPMYNWYIMPAYGTGYITETKEYKGSELLVKQNDIVRYTDNNHWFGKKWIAMGTSITANVPSYVPYLAYMSGMSCTKAGNGGGQITAGGTIYQNIIGRSFNNFDLCTLEGFVNDWYGNQPLGQVGDNTTDTFYGALYLALCHIKESNPNITLVLITDHHTRKTASFPGFDIFAKNTQELTQQDYRNAMKELCAFMGIPVIEAGETCGINYLTPDYYLDQIHHSEIGAQIFAKTIWSVLKDIPVFSVS